VTCSEHDPFERLPPYPVGPVFSSHEALADLRARHAGVADYDRALAAAESNLAGAIRFSEQQSDWAVRAAGVTQRNAIRRNATARCLDAYRARGLIL
jgi:hypothetical protein